MDKLAGKVALITGGTTGMGAATARRFATEGATVVVTGVSAGTLAQARSESPGVDVIASDASDLDAVRALVADVARRHGRIDVLVVNAGMGGYMPVGQVDEAFYDRLFDLNARGAFFLMQEAAKVMPDGGAMVLTGSIAHAMAMADNAVYAASKAALRSLGRSFAAELAPRGIRVNTISPGPVVTPIWSKLTGATGAQLHAMEAKIAARVPLKRAGQPEDIAAAALFLACAESGFVTGVDLPVDGGLMAIGFI